jgi:hypothetical protein
VALCVWLKRVIPSEKVLDPKSYGRSIKGFERYKYCTHFHHFFLPYPIIPQSKSLSSLQALFNTSNCKMQFTYGRVLLSGFFLALTSASPNPLRLEITLDTNLEGMSQRRSDDNCLTPFCRVARYQCPDNYVSTLWY